MEDLKAQAMARAGEEYATPTLGGMINVGMFSKNDLDLLTEALWKARQRSVTPAYRESLHKLATRFGALSSMLKS